MLVGLFKPAWASRWAKATESPALRRALRTDATKATSPPIPLISKLPSLSRRRVFAAAFASGTVFSILLVSWLESPKTTEHIVEEDPEVSAVGGKPRRIRLAEMKLHNGSSERPWVTKGGSVYDITDWVGAHPGGEVILRAAGGSIDPYWDIFTIHKKQEVYDILEQYKIGEIDEADLVDGNVPVDTIDDPFVADPIRDPRLRTLTSRPCNAETPESCLAKFLTPNDVFFVRNHMWVPVVEEPEHRLIIELSNGEEKSYTMKDLKARFTRHKITATLQCAGNRRKDMTDHARQTNGLQWTAGAISNAEWEGVRLGDVLADAGLDIQNLPADAKHTQFMGLEAYGASIPISKAVDPHGDVLLAFNMNGEDLPRDHGFPLRVIVPGNVAARSVKWLHKIVVSDEESLSQWQRRDYKCFGPNVGPNPDWSKAKSIQEMPITSAITSISNPSSQIPSNSNHEGSKPIRVEGYAYSGGGREIVRVDISIDSGRTWDQAELIDDQIKGSKAWCWKRWRYSGLKRDVGKTEVLVKATDETYNTQPENYDSIYNVRGNLSTAWHRIKLES